MSVKLMTSDLFYLNDVAKAIKQKDVIWKGYIMMGMDSLDCCVFTYLNSSKLSILPPKGILLNQRELSKFCSTISLEDGFELDKYGALESSDIIKTRSMIMNIQSSIIMDSKAEACFDRAVKVHNTMLQAQLKENDVTSEFGSLYGLSKSAGVKEKYVYNGHIMLLFGGALPLNKADRLYLTLMDNNDGTFYTKFRVHKKTCDVYVFMRFMNLR